MRLTANKKENISPVTTEKLDKMWKALNLNTQCKYSAQYFVPLNNTNI